TRKSPYTADRGMPGAYEGETVTRRRLFTGGVLAAGGIATAAFTLPALGFALGPMFEHTEARNWQDVGPVDDCRPPPYTSVVGPPPVRPLDRFETKTENGRVFVGHRFSVNSKLEKFSPRDPSNHLDGLWQILYPARPTT